MRVIEFEPGRASPLRIRLRDGRDRTLLDTAGNTLHLEVDTGTACVVIPAPRDPVTGEFVIATNDIDLPPLPASSPVRFYTAKIYIDRATGHGPVRRGVIGLKILEGCGDG